MRTTTLVFAAALLFTLARPALAQKVDVGGGVSRTKIAYDGEDYTSVGPMITVHLTDKHAIQLLTDINVRRWDYRQVPNAQGPAYLDVRGIYFVQYRHTLGSPTKRVAFSLSAG